MKNLLVDALRQASGRDEPLSPEDPATEPAPLAPPSDDSVVQDKDLELVDSVVLSASTAVKKANVDDGAVADPAMLLPALSLSNIAERDATDRAASPAAPAGRMPRSNPGLLVLLGRWSPALCLVALSAAAGTLALYQKMAAQNLNFDLDAMPSPVGRDFDDQSRTPTWLVIEETGDNRVEPALSSPPAAAADARERRAAGPGQATASQPDPGLVATTTTQIEDPAYVDVQAAYRAYSAGKFGLAERLYRRALATDKNHRHALGGLAAVLQRTARIDESLPIYERLLQIEPRDTAAAASLIAHVASADPAANETRVKVLIQRHPESAALHFALGLLMAEAERWPEAHEAFLNASSLAPVNADYSYNVAVSAQHLGRVGTARAYYEAALSSAGAESMVDRKAVSRQLESLSAGEGDSS